jgi:hypothetical protein
MTLQIVIGIVVVLLIAWAIISSRRHHLHRARQVKQQVITRKESWKQEKFMSYSAVQALREKLVQAVEENLESEVAATLKEIIDEWADLKIKTFQERRSWIRRPSK